MKKIKTQRLKLNEQEKRMLNHHISSIEKQFLRYLIGIPLILVVAATWYHLTKQGEFSTYFSIYSLFAVLIVLMLVIVFGFSGFNYFDLKEDKIEQKKTTFITKIQKIQPRQGTGMDEIKIYISPSYKGKNSIIWYPYIHEKPFHVRVGESVQFTVTTYASLPLKVEPVSIINPLDFY